MKTYSHVIFANGTERTKQHYNNLPGGYINLYQGAYKFFLKYILSKFDKLDCEYLEGQLIIY